MLLPPKLFNDILEIALRNLRWANEWNKYNREEDKNRSRHADDAVPIAKSKTQFQKVMLELEKTLQNFGLKVKLNKTKFLK